MKPGLTTDEIAALAEELRPFARSRPTTVAEMRTFVSDGIDYALTAPLISRFLGQDSKDALYAQKAFWQTADDATVAKLLSLMPAR